MYMYGNPEMSVNALTHTIGPQVETIGDAYMVAAGHDEDDEKERKGTPLVRVLGFARAMLDVVRNITAPNGERLRIRIGGPLEDGKAAGSPVRLGGNVTAHPDRCAVMDGWLGALVHGGRQAFRGWGRSLVEATRQGSTAGQHGRAGHRYCVMPFLLSSYGTLACGLWPLRCTPETRVPVPQACTAAPRSPA